MAQHQRISKSGSFKVDAARYPFQCEFRNEKVASERNPRRMWSVYTFPPQYRNRDHHVCLFWWEANQEHTFFIEIKNNYHIIYDSSESNQFIMFMPDKEVLLNGIQNGIYYNYLDNPNWYLSTSCKKTKKYYLSESSQGIGRPGGHWQCPATHHKEPSSIW